MGEPNYASLKVLIIDDFDSFRVTLSRMLNELGCRTLVTVMNGLQALEACRKQSFDLVMCDYNLGSGPNGQQVLEELRFKKLLSRDSLFLLISAESSQAIVLSAFDYSPDAYLTKPINGRSLQQRLDRLLRQRQEMLPVFARLDAGNTDGAIAQAEAAIAAGSRYSSFFQRLLGGLYLDRGKLDEAEQLYTRVLEVRPLDWAQVGIARVKKARGDLETSSRWLEQILQDNRFSMSAYDELADNYRRQGDEQRAQEVIQAAVEVSPLSLGRQAELAQTAAANHDLAVATRAYGRCVKLGENSCHDDCEYHLQYGRLTAEWLRESRLPNALELAKDGLRVLENLPRRFGLSQDQRLQVQLLECQLYAVQSDTKRALAQLEEVERQVQDAEAGLDLQFDRVATLKALGLHKKADALLSLLVEQYREDQVALQRIDIWLQEPVSEINRKLVAQLNNEGIGFYEANNYARALDSLSRAWRLFPHHLGVQLNLLQALVADMKQHGTTEDAATLCESLTSRIEATAQPGSPELNRLRQIQQALRSLA